MKREDLAVDSRFQTNQNRMDHVDQIENEVANWCRTLSTEECVAILNKAGIPCSSIVTPEEAMENPQIIKRKQVVKVEHPRLGKIAVPGIPFHFSDENLEVKPAPSLGQHNEEVYKKIIGFSDEKIQQLHNDGVI
jgi:crotonobetainyl-CoA:carnitine CoA-transferase CaiB-like acyl-CoA transferase